MKTRVYYHLTQGMAVASKLRGVPFIHVRTLSSSKPKKFHTWKAADQWLTNQGYWERKP